MTSSRQTARALWVALRAMLVFTLVLGVGYTAAVTAIGLALPAQANGSLVHDAAGRTVGSALIGQSFSDASGAPLPEWFQPRPSAAGDGYDAGASGGSNLGPENPELVQAIGERKAAVAAADGIPLGEVPADAVTASASGLDPHISPEYALAQAARVANARELPEARVRELVEAHVQGRDLGYLGEPTVNVLELNLALAALDR